MNKILFFTIFFISAFIFKGYGQCAPVYTTIYDTLCTGDTLEGYYQTGIYKDTFDRSGGCDSVRTLDLTVISNIGNAPLPAFFNTATNNNGGVISAGSKDLNWKVASGDIDSPYIAAVAMGPLPGNYSPSHWKDCSWISHNTQGTHSGNVDYFYKIDFYLPCADACGQSFDTDSIFCLSLDFMADNSVYEIYVNGVPQSGHIGAIPVASPYNFVGFQKDNMVSANFCNSWKSGYNSLVIHIRSGGPYAAFLAQASVSLPQPPVPHSEFDILSEAGSESADSGCAPFVAVFQNTSTGTSWYLWDFGDGSSLNTEQSPRHIYRVPGIYTVTLMAGSDCKLDTARKQIVISEAFHDTLSAAICSGDTYWLGNTPLTGSGFYTGMFTSRAGCDSFVHVYLTVYDFPEINIQTSASCRSKTNGQAIVYFPNGQDSCTYLWKDSNGHTLSIMKDLYAVPGGTYTLSITNRWGCTRDSSILIPEEQISFEVDTLFCVIDTIRFTNTSDVHMTSTWYFGDGSNSYERNPVHLYPHPGRYEVMLTGSGKGCTDTSYTFITIDTILADFSFLADKREICSGERIRFKPYADYTAVLLLWDMGDGNGLNTIIESIHHAYDQAGIFPAILKGIFRACPEQIFTDTIKVYPFPLVDLGPDAAICYKGVPVLLQNYAPGQGGYRYLWSTGDTSPVITVVYPGSYSLTIANEQGCAATGNITITKDCYTDIPNVFTPDGDGFNDYFFPRQLLSESMVAFRMQIFNRWGQVVFETNNTQGRGWDGKLNGKEQPEGVYVYTVQSTLMNGRAEKYKGNITLIR